jgi:hypothetical protein
MSCEPDDPCVNFPVRECTGPCDVFCERFPWKPGKPDDFEPTGWWRLLGPDGELKNESSFKKDSLDCRKPGDKMQRLYEKKVTEWRDEE